MARLCRRTKKGLFGHRSIREGNGKVGWVPWGGPGVPRTIHDIILSPARNNSRCTRDTWTQGVFLGQIGGRVTFLVWFVVLRNKSWSTNLFGSLISAYKRGIELAFWEGRDGYFLYCTYYTVGTALILWSFDHVCMYATHLSLVMPLSNYVFCFSMEWKFPWPRHLLSVILTSLHHNSA